MHYQAYLLASKAYDDLLLFRNRFYNFGESVRTKTIYTLQGVQIKALAVSLDVSIVALKASIDSFGP